MHVARSLVPLMQMFAYDDKTLPKAVVFDLDGCLWYPDMYMLWSGGGPPFAVRDDRDLDSVSGTRVYLLGDVRNILYALKTDPFYSDVAVGIASCTDEPGWARECLQKFEVGPAGSGVMLGDCVRPDMIEIFKDTKQTHLKNIAKTVGCDLEEILFFDNERGNCMDVAAIGTSVAFVPEGVTAKSWESALERFPEPGEIFDNRKES